MILVISEELEHHIWVSTLQLFYLSMRKQKTNDSSTILWPINPYQYERKLWNRSTSAVKSLSRHLGKGITPIYVSELADKNLRLSDKVYEAFEKKTEIRMNGKLKPLKRFLSERPQVLFDYEGKIRGKARSLAKYASSRGNCLVLAATHGRTGLRRLFKDSFVEDLVADSRIPVITINPNTVIPKKIKSILFATDFSAESSQAFNKLCEFSKELNAKIYIVSVLSDLVYFGDMPIVPPVTVTYSKVLSSFNDEQLQQLTRLGDEYKKRAEARGVRAEMNILETTSDISRAVLDQINELKTDMVALVAKSDTSTVHLFGTLTQKLIRKAAVPVWTYRHG